MTCAREIAEALQIDSGFAESRPRKKEEYLNMKQRTKVVERHKKTIQSKFLFAIDRLCNMLFK